MGVVCVCVFVCTFGTRRAAHRGAHRRSSEKTISTNRCNKNNNNNLGRVLSSSRWGMMILSLRLFAMRSVSVCFGLAVIMLGEIQFVWHAHKTLSVLRCFIDITQKWRYSIFRVVIVRDFRYSLKIEVRVIVCEIGCACDMLLN